MAMLQILQTIRKVSFQFAIINYWLEIVNLKSSANAVVYFTIWCEVANFY